jgi:hypothetical protein
MATNLTEEIAAKVSLLPRERQREALELIEQLVARPKTPVSQVPRAERKLKGATARAVRSVAKRYSNHGERCGESTCERMRVSSLIRTQ